MMETVYVESEVWDHPRTREIKERLSKASWVEIERYGEVFNRKSQNFRLQKKRPALILAKKHDSWVLPTEAYGLGASQHFYFSHMLNCLYDCRYCFLQGMFRSAHYVFFVNYEEFQQAIDETLQSVEGPTYFFSGYDCDSLAMEGLTGFVESFAPFFASRPKGILELRTKSTNFRVLREREPIANVVLAMSLTPPELSEILEHRVPPVERRLREISSIQQQGWNVGLRIDPLIYDHRFERLYGEFFEEIFSVLDPGRLHSVTLGPFRLPKAYHKTVEKLYPDETLFAGPLEERNGVVSYRKDIEESMRSFCEDRLRKYVDPSAFFSYEV